MRVFATSDLHLGTDRRGDRAVRALVRYLQDIGTPKDVLMILGDLGTSNSDIARCLNYFASFPGNKLAVAGNHDIWVTPEEGQDSTDQYRQLAQICQQQGFTLLDQESAVVNDIGFIGTMGWYDYSFRDLPGVPLEAYRDKIFPGESKPCWTDARLVRWSFSDEVVVEQQLHYLQGQLDRLEGKQVVVGMHHVPTKSLLWHPRRVVPAKWRFRNAFLGNRRFEKLFTEYADRIAYVLCGHIHSRSSTIIQGIPYASIGSTYEKKELVILGPGKRTTRRVFR